MLEGGGSHDERSARAGDPSGYRRGATPRRGGGWSPRRRAGRAGGARPGGRRRPPLGHRGREGAVGEYGGRPVVARRQGAAALGDLLGGDSGRTPGRARGRPSAATRRRQARDGWLL